VSYFNRLKNLQNIRSTNRQAKVSVDNEKSITIREGKSSKKFLIFGVIIVMKTTTTWLFAEHLQN
jgi:hypothetical protein